MKRSLRRNLGVVPVVFVLLAQLSQSAAFAKDTSPSKSVSRPADDAEQSAQAPSRPSDMPLALLPDPPPLQLPVPRSQSLQAIDAILGRIVSSDATQRERARGELLEVRPDWVSGLSKRIDTLAERADKSAMRSLLEKLRARAKRGAAGDGEEDGGADYVELVSSAADPSSTVWRDLTQILAMGRMLRHIGSAEAVRELIRIYVRFGDFMRINTQRELDALGDRQVAGLWEASRHPAPKISSWAQKRLDFLGKAIPHEAVRTKDPAALAEILVALGRTRDPDVGRVLVSFAATEKIQVRTAARQGIALLGEAASWQLRDAYQDTTGKAPPRDWTWKRTARELFTEFDRLRTSKVFELFEQGQKAQARGDLKAMSAAYDQVLALSPLFEQREKMASGYLKLAEALEPKDPPGAIAALRRAERIAATDEERHRAESLRYVLESRRLDEGDVVDRGLIDKALALDPQSRLAQQALERARSKNEEHSVLVRFLLAASVLFLSFFGAGYVALTTWQRRRSAPAPVAHAMPGFEGELERSPHGSLPPGLASDRSDEGAFDPPGAEQRTPAPPQDTLIDSRPVLPVDSSDPAEKHGGRLVSAEGEEQSTTTDPSRDSQNPSAEK